MINMVDFAISGFDIDPEKLGLTAEARFQIEKVVATDESIKSSIQRLKPINKLYATWYVYVLHAILISCNYLPEHTETNMNE